MTRPLTILVATSNGDRVADLAEAIGDRFELLPVLEGPPGTFPCAAICFVDWLLPAMSGAEMCRRLRGVPATADAQIVMVLDEDSREARARAMRAGADDYLVGPLTARHLLDRVGRDEAILPGAPTRQVAGTGLAINLATHQARWCGKPIALRPNELRLLSMLAQHPDRLLSRRQLIGLLGKANGEVDLRTVDVWIGRLRRALREQGAPDVVRTVRSLGYVFDSLAPTELIRA